MTLQQVWAMPAIPSGYTTDRIFRLRRSNEGESVRWTLRDAPLLHPFRKEYDSGLAEEWLESYPDAGPREELRFLGAHRDHRLLGVMTWRPLEWNDTLWLVDIRVREADRSTGVGSALLTWLQDQARRTGARGIFLETQTTNYPAVRFYRKHGFRVAGFNERLYTNRDLEGEEVALFMFWERE